MKKRILAKQKNGWEYSSVRENASVRVDYFQWFIGLHGVVGTCKTTPVDWYLERNVSRNVLHSHQNCKQWQPSLNQIRVCISKQVWRATGIIYALHGARLIRIAEKSRSQWQNKCICSIVWHWLWTYSAIHIKRVQNKVGSWCILFQRLPTGDSTCLHHL